jgi:hypothetical protein
VRALAAAGKTVKKKQDAAHISEKEVNSLLKHSSFLQSRETQEDNALLEKFCCRLGID